MNIQKRIKSSRQCYSRQKKVLKNITNITRKERRKHHESINHTSKKEGSTALRKEGFKRKGSMDERKSCRNGFTSIT